MRFGRTCVLTTAAAAAAPSKAQLRIRDSATKARILQGEQPQRGEGGVHMKTKEDGEKQGNHFVPTLLFHLLYSLQRLLRVNEHTDPC